MKNRLRTLCSVLLIGPVLLLFGGLEPGLTAFTVQPIIDADTVEMTVYRRGDLTLVEERRSLRLKEGTNRLQFNWGDRRVDPSSPQLSFRGSDGFHLRETTYPAGNQRSLIWEVEAERPVRTTAVVSYFFTGLTVEPRYDILVKNRSDTARLTARFRFTNGTGESLHPDQLNVLIGEVNLIESVQEIIHRWETTGDREESRSPRFEATSDQAQGVRRKLEASRAAMAAQVDRTVESARVSSDYHRMTLERSVEIPAESTSYVPFLTRGSVEYERRYEAIVRDEDVNLSQEFLIPNTRKNGLGATVLPEGSVNVLRRTNRGAPAWSGKSRLEYASPSDTASVQLSRTPDVTGEKQLLSLSKQDFSFDDEGNLRGWRETWREGVRLSNYRSEPIRVDVIRDFGRPYWTVVDASHPYRTPTDQRLGFTLGLSPESSSRITYDIRMPFGSLR